MSGFIQGESRTQSTLLPECLDDYIHEDNPVRVVDVFVDRLELGKLGFKVSPADTGRPGYHPATMLKLYIYGYLSRIPSSRRLEREAIRNVELIWLLGRLAPDFKTIADFRKDNGKAIKRVCREFVDLCRRLELFCGDVVAIDGSKFKAVNHYDKNFSSTKVKRRLEQLESSIKHYFKELESADRADSHVPEQRKLHLKEKIKAVEQEMARVNRIGEQLAESSETQVSLTDPDARSMRTKSKSSGIVGYNVQTAVDAENHLIVAHDVTNTGSDRSQLSRMAKQAKEAMGKERLTALADRGYYKGEEILACEQAGITPYVPKTQTSNNQAKGLFGKRDFIYIAEDDEYLCPAGQRAIWRMKTTDKGQTIYRYWSSACGQCPIKSQCTTGKERRISRWEHEDILDNMQNRLDKNPDVMSTRRSTVEHPYGTLKAWMGATHFTMRTLERVGTEMSLNVLSYNIKRVIKMIGVQPLLEGMNG
jgi:transposase